MEAARVDANQAELVKSWRDMGGTWLHLHAVGRGCPDGLAGMAGEMELVEIKTKTGKLNEWQRRWIRDWRGRPVRIIRTLDELIALADEMRARARERT